MPDPTRLVEVAMQLRGEANGPWNEFVLAMREYAAQAAMEVLKHPPETIVRGQGSAIGLGELAGVLANAPALYDKIRERKNHGGRHQPGTDTRGEVQT